MKTTLTLFSLLAITALISVSIWATSHIGIVDSMRELIAHPGDGPTNPWFIATLFDAYFGFLWFWLLVAYRERSHLARAVWLVLILFGGNIAMGTYMLIALARLPPGAGVAELLQRRPA